MRQGKAGKSAGLLAFAAAGSFLDRSKIPAITAEEQPGMMHIKQTAQTHLSVFLAVLTATFAVISCSTMPRRSVDIEIRNGSTNFLNWVAVLWDDGEQRAGVMPPGVSKISLDAGLPKSPKSDTAFIEFVDRNDGWINGARPNSERKHYRIPVDVSPLKRLNSGHYRVTFSILSFTQAELKIEKKDK